MELDDLGRDASGIPALHFDLLGAPRWRIGDGGARMLSRKDAVLIAMLALSGLQPRDVLAGRLWPEVDQRGAAANLRQRIARLRRDTGHRAFDTGPSVRLADGVAFDLASIPTMSAEALFYAGELLAGFDYTDNEFLHTWVNEQRERLRRARADALAGHAQRHEAKGEVVAALRLNERILSLMPLQEHAWRRQMRLHYLRGDRSSAIHAFERFDAMLRDETGTRPSEETLELLRTIEHAQPVAQKMRAVLPASLMRPPVLVGREPALRALARAWAAHRVFIVSASTGMGKSRLLSEHLQGQPGLVIEQGQPGDRQTPYSLLARLLRSVLGRQALALTEFTRSELARIVPEIGVAPPPAGQQAALWRAIENLFVQASQAGLCAVVVDDLQYADLATLEALRWLSASLLLADLRFGFATRPVDGIDAAALMHDWLGDSSRPELVELALLAPADVEALVASLGLPELEPVALGAALFRHAGGHPFFTLETLKDVVLHGQGQDGSSLPSPATAQTLLERRLRRLPPQALDLMRLAAVAGADLTVERAAQLLRCSALTLAAPWSELEAANVLEGLTFVHDLVRDCAMRLVPRVVRRVLHADLARMLAEDATVPHGRVAEHWQAAECWPEAATCLHAAGLAARYAGRLVEQQALLARAAECHRRVGNAAGEFDAVHDSLDGLLIRSGGAAVLAELPRLNALARSGEQRLKAMLMHAEALLDLTRAAEAAEVSAAAVEAAQHHPAHLSDALCMHGMALAQGGRLEDAISVQREAAFLTHASGDKAKALRATHALAFVLFIANRIPGAIVAQREAVRLAGDIGDSAELALAEGNLATFLSVIGDPPATYQQADKARTLHAAMGSSENGTQGGLNLVNLGGAAAFLGRFEEALAALAEAARILGAQASPAATAKARIALAGLWLTLGSAHAARGVLADMPPGTPPIWQAQWHLTLARAAALEGEPDDQHLQFVMHLLAANPALERTAALWHEWARHGEPLSVIAALRPVRAECDLQGQHGVSRALAVREIACHVGMPSSPDRDAVVDQAAGLLPHVAEGLHASTYPPEAWLILARAFERGGQLLTGQTCRDAALAWINDVALPNVPAPYRERFLGKNPVNRALLGAARSTRV